MKKDKFPHSISCSFASCWFSKADLAKFSLVSVHLPSPLNNPLQDMSVRNTNQTNVLKAKRCESASPDPPISPGILQACHRSHGYCVHHLFKDIQTATVLNMSRKIHCGQRELTNKFIIEKNIYLNGA